MDDAAVPHAPGAAGAQLSRSEQHRAQPATRASARPYTGIIAAPLLPMLPDQSVDWDALRRYVRWIADQGPAGIAMNMDASEGVALTVEEQDQVVRVCRQELGHGGGPHLFSGIVAGSTAAAAARARRLRELGADGLVPFPTFPTFLGTPLPVEMVYRFHAAVARAGELPIIAFQFPKGWGPDYSAEMLAAVAGLPELVGIKESSFDANMTLQAVANAAALGTDRPGVLTGSDTFIFEAMVMGCDGALIGFGGTCTQEIVAMQRAVAGGDLVAGKAIWDRIGPIARHCWRPPIRDFRPRMKEVLRLQGLFPHATVREPQLGVDDAERAALRRVAEEAGLI